MVPGGRDTRSTSRSSKTGRPSDGWMHHGRTEATPDGRGHDVDQQATGHFTDPRWDETTITEHDAGKLARADVGFTYTGDLEAEGAVTYLMAYGPDGTGTYVGYELITGALDGRHGTFVVRHDGVFDGTAARADWTVVPGSATGELAGLTGAGRVEAPYAGGPYPYELDWSLDRADADADADADAPA